MNESAKILIVENSESLFDSLKKNLSFLGYIIRHVDNGRATIDFLKKEIPDLILLDLFLPELSGLEVLSVLKSSELYKDIPVITMTEKDDLEIAVESITKGADDFIPKIFNPVCIQNKIKSLLEKKSYCHAFIERKISQDKIKSFLAQLVENKLSLEKALKEKSNLEQMLIHDIKTPLSSLLLALEIGLENKGEAMLTLVEEALMIGLSMQNLIEELSDIVKGGEVCIDLELRTFSLYDLVENCFRVISFQARDLEVELVNSIVETESMITADYNIMQRVLINLLSNAIEYSPENTKVEVFMCYEKHWVRIQVKDQGHGISDEQLEAILEASNQIRKSDKNKKRSGKKSTGLGLQFCKLAVEKHGGIIMIHDNVPKGTDISIYLPISRSENSQLS